MGGQEHPVLQLPHAWPSTSGGAQGGLSQLPLFPFQDLCWSEGEGENKTKPKRTTDKMQLRRTIVVLGPKRWDSYFSLALMLASIIVRLPDHQGLERVCTVGGCVGASFLLIAQYEGRTFLFLL